MSRERVITCALEVIERDGLEGLRLETLAKKLHVSAPSLYHHFANKDEILTSCATAIYMSAPVRPARECGPDNVVDYFVAVAIESHRAMTIRPRCLPLLASYTSPDILLTGRERSLRALARTNVPKEYHGLITEFVERIVHGWVFLISMPSAEPSEDRWPYLAEFIGSGRSFEPERAIELSIRAFFTGLLPVASQATAGALSL
jgi:AcrR family transcriptional regulator